MNIRPDGINNAIATLRSRLPDGKTILQFDQGLLTLDWDRQDTDAAEFANLVEEARALRGELDFRTLPTDLAREIDETAKNALKLWTGSPATGFLEAVDRKIVSEFTDNEVALSFDLIDLDEIVNHWNKSFRDALIIWSDCSLASSSDKATIKPVVAKLMAMAQEPDPDEAVWPRLLAATSRSDPERHSQAWALCEAAYLGVDEDLPQDLHEFRPRRSTQLASPRREPRQSAEAPEANRDFRLQLFDDLGVLPASALHLRGSRLEPLECIARTTAILHSSGVLAGKWVTEPHVHRQLEELLYRLDTEGDPDLVDVKFLVLDPASDAYSELSEKRAGEPSFDSVNKLIALSKKYQCLEVRGFSHIPSLRYIAIDEDIVSISPYAIEEEAYKTSREGWDAPHVILDPLARYPLASVFRSFFEMDWNSAEQLETPFR